MMSSCSEAENGQRMLCYPSLKQNTSHAELLGGFVDVCESDSDDPSGFLVAKSVWRVLKCGGSSDDSDEDIAGELLQSVEVNIGGKILNIRPVYCGMKGDWPFLRKICKLQSGFQALRKCHLCDSVEWWDMSRSGRLRNLAPGYHNPSPYKRNMHSPVFDLAGGSSPHRIRTDPVHTYHIGYGKDEHASVVVLLAYLGHFGARGSMDKKLEDAFERFATWCKSNSKHT
ncbi:unnamed protein product, partial [Durusdinium trenchii]